MRAVVQIVALSLLLCGTAQAVPITIFGTGLDAAGNPLAAGAADPHFVVVETGTAARVISNTSAYLPNDANSQWIWENASGLPISVTRTFRTTFDLTGLDPTSAVINGAWGTDNQGLDIILNGVSTGISLLGVVTGNFTALHGFTISAGFQNGLNTLDFVVQDNGGIAAFRTALRGTADELGVPEPAGIALLSLGLLALRRRASRVRAS